MDTHALTEGHQTVAFLPPELFMLCSHVPINVQVLSASLSLFPLF